jgi:hypothetical protein
MTKTFEIDIAHDCPLGDYLEALEKYNLKIESFIAIGPAGGNPCMTLSGSTENIRKYLSEFHFLDNEEIVELYLQ